MVQLIFQFCKSQHSLPVDSFWAHISHNLFLLLKTKKTLMDTVHDILQSELKNDCGANNKTFPCGISSKVLW